MSGAQNLQDTLQKWLEDASDPIVLCSELSKLQFCFTVANILQYPMEGIGIEHQLYYPRIVVRVQYTNLTTILS